MPWVIAGTGICKLVTRSLVVEGLRIKACPNSIVQRYIVSEEAHARRSSVWSNSYESVHRTLLRHRVFFVANFLQHARLEVLPNLRHALGVFQMSTMVNLGIGLTRRWAFALPLCKITGDIQIAGKWSKSEKISCHAILKKLHEPKMDVILTISFKITAEIEIRKHVLPSLRRRWGVLHCKADNVFSFIHSLPWNE